MKLTRFLVTFALLVGVTGVASAQVGSISLWWDACSSTATPAANLNKQFAGPAVYTQVISAQQVEEVAQGWEFAIKISTPSPVFPDAWRFEAGGCNQDLLVGSTARLNLACPKLEGTNQLPLFKYDYNNAVSGPNRGVIQAFNAYDPFDPTASATYTIAILRYDHTSSGPGPNDPLVHCGLADAPVCHHITRHGFLNAANTVVNWPVGNEFVTWNDASNVSQCPGATPTQASTWGKLKGTYRQ